MASSLLGYMLVFRAPMQPHPRKGEDHAILHRPAL